MKMSSSDALGTKEDRGAVPWPMCAQNRSRSIDISAKGHAAVC